MIRGKAPKTVIGLLAVAATLALASDTALADPAPHWRIDSISDTTAAPGDELVYTVIVTNDTKAEVSIPESTGGNAENCVAGAPAPADPSRCIRVSASFPPGLIPVKAEHRGFGPCAKTTASVTCSIPNYQGFEPIPSRMIVRVIRINVKVSTLASGTLTAQLEASGAGMPAIHTVDPLRVSTAAQFGFESLDAALSADEAGTPASQAGGHPWQMTNWLQFNKRTREPFHYAGWASPVEAIHDVVVDLPPGLVGVTATAERCTTVDLAAGSGPEVKSTCSSESQIGRAVVQEAGGFNGPDRKRAVPVYNMVPTPGAAAMLGFNVTNVLVSITATVKQRSDGEYVISTTGAKTSQAIGVTGVEIELWGIPSDPGHTWDRACPGRPSPEFGFNETCESSAPREAFFRSPTSCSPAGRGLGFAGFADSWEHPGATLPGGAPDPADPAWATTAMETHEPPGSPRPPSEWGAPVGTEGCGAVPFDPSFAARATTNAADSPSGLEIELSMPQAGLTDPDAIAEADLRDAVVRLPEGMAINPAAASGISGCTASEIGLKSPLGSTPILFSAAAQSCPDAAKVGTVTLETPLLDHPLRGGVYLAAQEDNPFGSLLALYLAVEDPETGIVLKLPGRVDTGPEGQLQTTFSQNPQMPFAELKVSLYGGPRAPLRTPAACGTHTARATLTPWSGNAPAELASSFEITQGCGGGFDPKLKAGTENPLAGTYSPFNLQITRADGTQELGGLQVSLPPGLVSALRYYTYCPDATLAAISSSLGTGKGEEASPACPASSRVGSVTVGAGAGPNPFYTSSGRAYIAGPYKGAAVSLAVVAPAVAGPFDLGSVVVRNPIYVDPSTAQLTLKSDPLPTVLHGIPLDLRDIRVRYDQTLNPTNCDPMQVGSTLTSTQGTAVNRDVAFQVAGCDRLGFKPKLTLQLKGATHRNAHPTLRAVLRARPGDANISETTVLLPKTELLENAHIRTICTRVQYAAGGGGGRGCPKGSIYGYAKAWTPLLAEPLQGPVYLRANGGERELPDLVASLDGQIHVDLVGFIDSVNGRIRNRFNVVPDAPVEKFELTMQGGKKGLLANNTELCRAKPRATTLLSAQNNKLQSLTPLVKVDCGKAKRKR